MVGFITEPKRPVMVTFVFKDSKVTNHMVPEETAKHMLLSFNELKAQRYIFPHSNGLKSIDFTTLASINIEYATVFDAEQALKELPTIV